MIGDNEDIGGAEIDQGADIKAETEIGNDAHEMRYEYQQDELVEPDRLFPLGRRIDYVLIKGLAKEDERVVQEVN
jgi:hypothetical protein